jgi:4-hydroxysphinganine ceramide fatty acyl 2-hydroxylase
MPARTLPTFTQEEIQSKNTAELCYVTVGEKVYDVTDFLEGHPGGADLILDYGGKDITEILKDEASHTHSEAAYEILDESLIGFIESDDKLDSALKRRHVGQSAEFQTGQSVNSPGGEGGNVRMVYASTGVGTAEDLNKDTDLAEDYKKHKFIDLNKPMLMQVFTGGFSKKFYLEQVHRPRHYKGGASAPIFGNFLEPLSLTPWWVIPILWGPLVTYGLYRAGEGLSFLSLVALWACGLGIWTILEYGLHRFLFHLDE